MVMGPPDDLTDKPTRPANPRDQHDEPRADHRPPTKREHRPAPPSHQGPSPLWKVYASICAAVTVVGGTTLLLLGADEPPDSSLPSWASPPVRCPPLPMPPDPHPEANEEEAEIMTHLRMNLVEDARQLPPDLAEAQETFGRTVFAEEREALWLHVELCLGDTHFRTMMAGVEERASEFFEQYPQSRWRPVIERELDERPLPAP